MKKKLIVFLLLVFAVVLFAQTTYVKQKLPQIWVTDGDTLKIDPYKGLYALRFSLAGTDKFRLDSLGNITGKRDVLLTTQKTPAASDSALQLLVSTLQPTITFWGTDGDNYSISIDSSDMAVFKNTGTIKIIDSNGDFRSSGNVYLSAAAGSDLILRSLGAVSGLIVDQDGFVGIPGTISPKGSSLTLGNKTNQRDLLTTREAVPAGTDSSVIIGVTGPNGYVQINSGAGVIIQNVGIQPASYVSSTNQMWISATADTLYVRQAGNAFFVKLTDFGKVH